MPTLNVTITEEIDINGSNRGSTNVYTIQNVDLVLYQNMSVPNSETNLISFDAAIAGPYVAPGNVEYLRITSSSGTVDLRIRGTNEEYFVRIGIGESFILNNSSIDANASTTTQNVSLGSISYISGKGTSAQAPSTVEIFAAA